MSTVKFIHFFLLKPVLLGFLICRNLLFKVQLIHSVSFVYSFDCLDPILWTKSCLVAMSSVAVIGEYLGSVGSPGIPGMVCNYKMWQF